MTDTPMANQEAADSSTSRLTARELIFLLPNLGKLLWRLARDRRVPLSVKLLVVGTGIYLAMPFDVIPDWLPGVGYLDDAILVGFVVHRLIRRVSPEVLAEHWDGAISLPDLARKISFRTKSRAGGVQPGQEQTR